MSKKLVSSDPKDQTTNSIDLLAFSSLGVELIIAITDFIESLHHKTDLNQTTIDTKKTTGISPFVYQSIRNITRFSASALAPLLKKVNLIIAKAEPTQKQQKLLAILNGLIGDHLQQSNNTLAIPMHFRKNGQVLSEQSLTELLNQSQGKILILVHGSCMNDLLWRHNEHDHGEALAQELGLTPIYLNYNSGLHISENGRQFSLCLDSLVKSTTKPLELHILAHSMGGLVSRSACYYAQAENKSWLKQLNKMIFLGTPHQGAPLEKMGHWLEQVLSAYTYTARFTKLTQIRSNGITDLRYGYILDEEWSTNEVNSTNQKQAIELPLSVECFAVAGTMLNKANRLSDAIIGDGLVNVDSALGKHKKEALQLDFPIENQMLARNVNHMALLSNPVVYLQLKNWLDKGAGHAPST